LAALALAACGSSSGSSMSSASSSAASGGGSLALGTKNFTEAFIVGQLYTQALTAKGCRVKDKQNIGPTEVVDKALTSGQIDAYPEYTGESVATVAGINKTVTSPQEEYRLAKQFYAKRGQVMSQMTPFVDTDAIAVTKAFAAQHGLKTTADLNKVGHFTLGARPEFLNRQEGALGMKKVYGVITPR
jgi:osmoprotectant transport system substrate-binding protein